MKPCKIEDDGTPVFTTLQIENFGLPDYYGYHVYLVIEQRDSQIFYTDFQMEQELEIKKIHRYDRYERFKNTLLQLMGERGKVPNYILEYVDNELTDYKTDLWNKIREILKKLGKRIYYNRIPCIIRYCTKQRICSFTYTQYINILDQFKIFSWKFDQQKELLNRKYFPNMRYVALKLIQLNNVQLNYQAPFTRTKRIGQELDIIWNILND